MSNELADIPIERREILYVVEDGGTQGFLEMERKQQPNCTIATLAEISNFDRSLTITPNSILIWDSFEEKYKTCADLLNDPEKFTFELCNFCENYLGAIEGSIYIEEKIHESGGTKVEVDGKGNVQGDGKKFKTSGDIDISLKRQEKTEKRIACKFNHNPPVAFEKNKATGYYRSKGLEKFDIFKRLYESRVEHGSDYEGKCCFESYIMEERKNQVSVAVDFAVELQGILGVDAHIGVSKESLKGYSKTIKMEFTFK